MKCFKYLLLFILGLASNLATAQPENNECQGAINIPDIANWCSAPAFFNNNGATPSGYQAPVCWGGANNDVWYTFTPSSDLVEIRKLILFINDAFPDLNSWRFVDADYVFPNPTNPFASTFPEVINFNDLTEDEIANFMAIKVGDVNGSATANELLQGDTRNKNGKLQLGPKD